ncbi:MAG: hypothetical protein GY757_00750 [bacterium]|nr:hypothetical protein [bacterium]
MKKNLTIFVLAMVLSLFVAGNLVAAESGAPTEDFQKLLDMEHDHADAVADFLNTIPLDTHPEYGYVKKEALPCYKDGWDEKNVNELFPKGKVLSYNVKEMELSGVALVAHKARDGKTFYVWHRYEKEAAVFVVAEVEIDGEVQSQDSMAFKSCGNNAYKAEIWWLYSEDLVFYVNGVRVPWWVAKGYLRLQ